MSESGDGEIPQEVAQEARQEFGQQPEVNRKTWNERFNAVADKLQQVIYASQQQHTQFRQGLPYKDDENVVVGMGKAYVKGAEGATWTISNVELNALKSLAELGARATGGRVSNLETQESK